MEMPHQYVPESCTVEQVLQGVKNDLILYSRTGGAKGIWFHPHPYGESCVGHCKIITLEDE